MLATALVRSTAQRRPSDPSVLTATIGEDAARLIHLDGASHSVAYFRAGYAPGDYPSEAEWAGRLLIERSGAAKSPSACKYTEEGSIVDSMLKQVALAERRMESLASLEYTLTASDKEELLKAYAAKAAEQGADVKFTAAMAPDKLTLG